MPLSRRDSLQSGLQPENESLEWEGGASGTPYLIPLLDHFMIQAKQRGKSTPFQLLEYQMEWEGGASGTPYPLLDHFMKGRKVYQGSCRRSWPFLLRAGLTARTLLIRIRNHALK